MPEPGSPLDAKAREVARVVGEHVAEWNAAKEDELAAAIVGLCRGWVEPILRTVAVEIRACKGCGTPLAFCRNTRGVLVPYQLDGVNHFITCPKRDQFKSAGPKDRRENPVQQTAAAVDVGEQQRFDAVPPGRMPG